MRVIVPGERVVVTSKTQPRENSRDASNAYWYTPGQDPPYCFPGPDYWDRVTGLLGHTPNLTAFMLDRRLWKGGWPCGS